MAASRNDSKRRKPQASRVRFTAAACGTTRQTSTALRIYHKIAFLKWPSSIFSPKTYALASHAYVSADAWANIGSQAVVFLSRVSWSSLVPNHWTYWATISGESLGSLIVSKRPVVSGYGNPGHSGSNFRLKKAEDLQRMLL
jgi:hypothetical protein